MFLVRKHRVVLVGKLVAIWSITKCFWKHRVVLVRKHKGLFGVFLCSSGQEIQYWVSRLISKLSTPRKPIIFHSVGLKLNSELSGVP